RSIRRPYTRPSDAEVNPEMVGRHIDIDADRDLDAVLDGGFADALDVGTVVDHECDPSSCLDDVADGFEFGVMPYRIRDEQVREPVGREMGRLVAGIAHHAAESLVVEDISEYVPTPDGFRCDP